MGRGRAAGLDAARGLEALYAADRARALQQRATALRRRRAAAASVRRWVGVLGCCGVGLLRVHMRDAFTLDYCLLFSL